MLEQDQDGRRSQGVGKALISITGKGQILQGELGVGPFQRTCTLQLSDKGGIRFLPGLVEMVLLPGVPAGHQLILPLNPPLVAPA